MKWNKFALPALVLALAGCSAPAATQDGPTVASTSAAATPAATRTATALPAGRFKLNTKFGAESTFTLPTQRWTRQ